MDLFKSLSWSFMEQVVLKVVTLLVQIILARLLSPEDFGVLAILLVVTTFADAIAQSGLGIALIQSQKKSITSYSTVLILSIILAILMYILIFALAPFIAQLYQKEMLSLYLRVLGIIVFFNSINSVMRAIFQKDLDFKSLFFASLIAVLVSGTAGIVCAINDFGVWSLIIQYIVQVICTCVALKVLASWKFVFAFSFTEAKELFSYGWKVGLTSIIGSVYVGFCDLVIGKACTVEDLGYYSQGKKYPDAAMTALSNAVANVLLPTYASLQNDLKKLRAEIKKAIKVGSYIIFPISFFCAAAAEPIVGLLLTDKWLPCVFIFQMSCIAGAFIIVELANLRAYMALGHSELYLKLQIVKVTIGIAAICGVAIITQNVNLTALTYCIVSILFMLVIDLFPAKKYLGYSGLTQLKDVSGSFFCSLICSFLAFSISFFLSNYALLLLTQLIIYFVAYFFISRPFCRYEFETVKKILKRIIAKVTKSQ